MQKYAIFVKKHLKINMFQKKYRKDQENIEVLYIVFVINDTHRDRLVLY